MQIGIPREIKDGEARVAATPETVRALAAEGHTILVETGAGLGSGFSDESYRVAGAQLASRPEEIYACPLVVKVKELQLDEYERVRPGCIVFGYQQLARDARLLEAVLRRRVTCLAYEGVLADDGRRPLLAPMSTIAGLLSAQIAAWALQHREGPLAGSGVLLPWLDGIPQAHVLIVGDGTAGGAAARAFLSLGCDVVVLGKGMGRLAELQRQLAGCGRGPLRTAVSSATELSERTAESDVVIGAVSVPGRLAPKLITREMLRSMRPGSVFIDIGIDMGGIAETSRQTKLSDPMYLEERVLHYCVPNIPALVPRAATQALAAATLPYVRLVAGRGLGGAMDVTPGLRDALLVHDGDVVHPGLAEDTGRTVAEYPRGAVRKGSSNE
jgi:alanine dehydrogenase